MFLDNTYYIVFKEAKRSYWYMKLLRKGFSHCFVIKPERGYWVRYEVGHGKTVIDIHYNYAELIENSIIVKVQGVERKQWIFINSCVSAVKRLTGLGGFALTPYQLYKRVT